MKRELNNPTKIVKPNMRLLYHFIEKNLIIFDNEHPLLTESPGLFENEQSLEDKQSSKDRQSSSPNDFKGTIPVKIK